MVLRRSFVTKQSHQDSKGQNIITQLKSDGFRTNQFSSATSGYQDVEIRINSQITNQAAESPNKRSSNSKLCNKSITIKSINADVAH